MRFPVTPSRYSIMCVSWIDRNNWSYGENWSNGNYWYYRCNHCHSMGFTQHNTTIQCESCRQNANKIPLKIHVGLDLTSDGLVDTASVFQVMRRVIVG